MRECARTLDIRGTFVPVEAQQYGVIRDIMHRVRTGAPFAWMRIGDGDLIKSFNVETNANVLRSAASTWRHMDSAFHIGTSVHWLCDTNVRARWNALIDAAHASEVHFFDFLYLPMGDPADVHTELWHTRGVNGWIIEAYRRYVVVVGPALLREADRFLPYNDFIEVQPYAQLDIESAYPPILAQMMNASARRDTGVLFVVSAGSLSKVLIPLAYVAFGKDAFIDVGAALDPYTGHASADGVPRDYVNLMHYCAAARQWHAPDTVPRKWMDNRTCDRVERRAARRRARASGVIWWGVHYPVTTGFIVAAILTGAAACFARVVHGRRWTRVVHPPRGWIGPAGAHEHVV